MGDEPEDNDKKVESEKDGELKAKMMTDLIAVNKANAKERYEKVWEKYAGLIFPLVPALFIQSPLVFLD